MNDHRAKLDALFTPRRQVPRKDIEPARLASLSREGYARVMGVSLYAPLSDELESVNSRALLQKLRIPAWPGRRR